jgi:hypothetical protein
MGFAKKHREDSSLAMRWNAWHKNVPWAVAGIAAALAFTGCGCSRPNPYIPSSEAAVQALTAVLDSWKNGQAMESIATPSAVVRVADTQRQSGHVLRSYEILGERSAEGGRRFAVRLNFAPPAQQLQAQYVVVGLDPLWVFRQEDYDMLLHWDHPMNPSKDEDPGNAE